jgi:hypothetical protein
MKKPKKPPLCICKSCGRSSVVESKCAFEDLDKMAYCPTFIRQREKKK